MQTRATGTSISLPIGTPTTITFRARASTAGVKVRFVIQDSTYNTLNPYDPALLRVNGIEHDGNQISLTIPAPPGHDFILWKSSTLATGSWQKVTDAVSTESNGQLILTDPNPGTTRAFYRIQRDTGL